MEEEDGGNPIMRIKNDRLNFVSFAGRELQESCVRFLRFSFEFQLHANAHARTYTRSPSVDRTDAMTFPMQSQP